MIICIYKWLKKYVFPHLCALGVALRPLPLPLSLTLSSLYPLPLGLKLGGTLALALKL